ncbi:hypothetical protein BO86DRAFT_387979 [Aspergillus japonicus CBS 114.51]|uniref:Tubby C-terminal-like domain-containing protein n=3 Tax=Aspergillus TaxID=5052 RepID=A0A2V5HG73_ASPV1|nr:hypothetical protein BO86DRAFT_387979 [Aspergillus japonicus CBS 114.51]PYI23365.1 hypothetical protein BO99DRAFT_479153 [Aspergillus violaceofuscus CBS 115571]PYI25404.1 hypothetical protein BP00DRAFT_431270 [Aspergillus indologenus CBS 114.80]RAH83379.1 hypothetical protein BO86DRAFT_387979 [Aspergillus japonicus CBS 114.51]
MFWFLSHRRRQQHQQQALLPLFSLLSSASSSSSSASSSSLQIRRVLKAPGRPIAIRADQITDTKTTLVVRPQGDAQSAVAYKIEDLDGVTLFTATGRKFSHRPCREFRDASGLPLFELHRRLSFRNNWSVTLPGSSIKDKTYSPLATGSRRRATRRSAASFGSTTRGGNFTITFDNVAAVDGKQPEERVLTLEVQRHGNVLALFDIVDGDRKIAEVRESIRHNEKLALMPASRVGYRPVLDVIVTPGVDLALVATIAVIASDTVFASNY